MKSQKDIATGKPANQRDYRVQLVYKGTEDIHAILKDKATYREAKILFYGSNSGMETDLQLIDFVTGEVIMRG